MIFYLTDTNYTTLFCLVKQILSTAASNSFLQLFVFLLTLPK